jgi:proteic killer suppression protein
MIKSFKHKGLQLFYVSGSKAGIKASHANRLKRQLFALNQTQAPDEMDVPGWRLHPMRGFEYKGYWAITVNANWRLIFAFELTNAVCVDYLDYH